MQQCAFTILSITQIREEQKRSAQKLNVSVKQIILIIFHQTSTFFESSRKRKTEKEMLQLFWISIANPTSERLSLGLRVNLSGVGLVHRIELEVELCIRTPSIRALE